MKMDKILVGSVIALLAFSVVVANVFVYYPWQVTVSPVSPPITFQKGSNADKTDLSGSISVTLGENNAFATITIHPTYRVTYYKDVLRISNTDTKAYYVYIVLDGKTGSLPSLSRVVLYVYQSGTARDLSGWMTPEPESGTYLKMINLTTLNINAPTPVDVPISGGSKWEIDIYVYIPEGESLSQVTFNLHLVYTPTQENPP
ncbi:MAG: hypothetical protein RMI83_06170 [Desulfurococcaceae archaeon]|nr:hypothetical protein [Sulfolobales archaeon]MDW8170663.1 hypothetical protein [Desulfurococcaceae archaeon]